MHQGCLENDGVTLEDSLHTASWTVATEEVTEAETRQEIQALTLPQTAAAMQFLWAYECSVSDDETNPK